MKQRCRYRKQCRYPIYGGRGIDYEERWESFSAFLEDMGLRPQGTSLERINGNLGYSKSNCVWATPAQQSRNKSDNVWISSKGKRQCVTDWSRETGIGITTILWRLRKGFPNDMVLNPDKTHGKFQRRKTHCPQGHPYDEKNTYRNSGSRKCRTCNRIRAQALRDKKKNDGIPTQTTLSKCEP